MMSWSACLLRSATDLLGPHQSARPATSYTTGWDTIVFDARLRWKPRAGGAGPFAAGEFALQRNRNFDMNATGVTAEVGYTVASRWSPALSYRFARFTGDDPGTATFERWDPLLSGGNGEQWVQGINHFKLFQNANLITHRLQMRLRPAPQVELVPQLWLFQADSTANLAGNPGLGFLSGSNLALEANLTPRWFVSKKIFVQAHVAATFPTDTVEETVGTELDPWLSTMVFVRVAF